MTLTELRYLVNLDKERHFSRAAERSFVSQPTLSVALKKLEEELGVVLLERSRGEARPTPIGERIIEQARRVLAEAAMVKDIAKSGQDEIRGALRLGAIYTVGPYVLPSIIPILRKKTPEMPLVIEENFTTRLLEQLRANELDVALLAEPFDTVGLSTWPIFDEDFKVLMSIDHPWAKRTKIPSKELAEQPLLLLGQGHCFRDQVIEACPKCIDPEADGPKAQTGSSLETIRHMVASGLGITVVPSVSVENRPEDPSLLVAKPMYDPLPQRRVVMAWRKTFPRLKAIQALREVILASPIRGITLLPDENIANGGYPMSKN